MIGRILSHYKVLEEIGRATIIWGPGKVKLDGSVRMPLSFDPSLSPLVFPTALTAGNRVGSYEILSPIGAGGMGGVYEAEDSGSICSEFSTLAV